MTATVEHDTVRPFPLGPVRSRLGRIAELIATPLVPGDYLDLIAPLRSGADLRGRIIAKSAETADAATLTIRAGRDWTGHTPGEYVRLGVEVDGVRYWRAYSVTSAPTRDRTFTVTVKAVPEGIVSNHLVRRLDVGAIVRLEPANGEFVLPRTAPAKALFVTAGSGITPVMGMLRSYRFSDAVVVHSAPTAADVIFGAELRELAAAGAVRLIERYTASEGLLDVRALAELVPDLAERHTWACGPAGLLDAVGAHFTELGLDENLTTERFRPAVLATGEGGTLTFSRTGVEVDADGATSLLEVGEAAGVLMPSGCRMGVCFGCVVPLREGAVRDLRSGDLTTAAPGDGVLVQTCVTAAAGSCDIEL